MTTTSTDPRDQRSIGPWLPVKVMGNDKLHNRDVSLQATVGGIQTPSGVVISLQ